MAKRTSKKGPKKEPEVLERSNALVTTIPRPVIIQRDTVLDYPELYMTVYVSENEEKKLAEMFAKARCSFTNDLDKADLVVFTGGSDVDPSLYKEKQHTKTVVNAVQDQRDLALYREALERRIPMFGICRGAQFLHVMQGGTLHQDVNNHVGDHGMVFQGRPGYIDKVSSTHHQAVVENSLMEVLGYVYHSDARWTAGVQTRANRKLKDIEAFFYPHNCILGVQGHPEYRGYSKFTAWCLQTIEDKIVHHPHIVVENKCYRTKKSLIILDKQ